MACTSANDSGGNAPDLLSTKVRTAIKCVLVQPFVYPDFLLRVGNQRSMDAGERFQIVADSFGLSFRTPCTDGKNWIKLRNPFILTSIKSYFKVRLKGGPDENGHDDVQGTDHDSS